MDTATATSQLQLSDPLARRAVYGTTSALTSGQLVPRHQQFQKIRHKQRRMVYTNKRYPMVLLKQLTQCLSSWLRSLTTH
ncbi:hypothetical protein FOC4_g10001754 [Fusarium odoratissimum]|uniref:Uncharacterized protein n=1 Tax=Fusarium oxysporum f. sp. cubense (strain race 4) TaxID=2502994 RepID=N1S0A2_FUSC4|nr:hypothetical protein FOC4_g10001754 [Fusarium odoratissimum]